MFPWLYRSRDRLREYLGTARTARLLTLLLERMVDMQATQQDIIDALTAESADLATFAATLKNLLGDIDALLAVGVSGTSAATVLASIGANRATIGKLAGEIVAEAAKVAPPPPAPIPVPPEPVPPEPVPVS